MIAVMLLYVGAVLLLNGVWILGSAVAREARPAVEGGPEPGTARAAYLVLSSREVGVFNLLVGALGFVLALFAFARVGPAAIGALELEFGAFVLLFAFTYLYVGINQFLNTDGRALGWYCLFVAITAVPTAVITLLTSQGHAWPLWLGADWAAWAVVWFLFWVLLALQRPIALMTGVIVVFVAVSTSWVPAYLLLVGRLPGS